MSIVVKLSTKYQVTEKIKGKLLGVRTVQNHGRIQIPKTVREQLQIRDGDSAYWLENENNEVVLKKATVIT